jgi:hypothetical protein
MISSYPPEMRRQLTIVIRNCEALRARWTATFSTAPE